MVLHPESNQFPASMLPDDAALKRSRRVSDALCSYIEEQGGIIRFDQYMEFVLYDPRLGYYSSGSCRFDEEGDFTTAPEYSSLFSICLARQCASILAELDDACILEIGAGSGKMASVLLQQLERHGILPNTYFISEISPVLRQRQQRLLRESVPHLYDRVCWLVTPTEPFSGIVLANEVIDALPIRRFTLKQQQPWENNVGLDDQGRLVSIMQRPDRVFIDAVERLLVSLPAPLPDGYQTEVNLQLASWLSPLSALLKRGVMLFIDYGYPQKEYYHSQRQRGTLLCHYRYHVHDDPLIYPGIQDITASVNFTALAEAASQLALEVAGYTAQAYFLMANGLDQALCCSFPDDAQSRLQATHQARLLTLPGKMGERFKVMALTRDFRNALRGFSIRDQRCLL